MSKKLLLCLFLQIVPDGGSGLPTSQLPPPPMQLPPQLVLSELPEPPIALSEIGPIPPPPMFSSPSPTALIRQKCTPTSNTAPGNLLNAAPLDLSDYEGKY